MLRELYIKNFALIRELRIDFQLGLNIITGETGSGKSIMLDALSLCLGKRGDKSLIKQGESKCIIEAVFSTENKEITNILNENNIEVDEDIIIYREISEDGRSIARINSRTVNLSVIKNISKFLINIHGQNEHDNLMDSENQLKLLDGFVGEEILLLKEEYLSLFDTYKNLLDEFDSLKVNKTPEEIEREKDFLSYIITEITTANVAEGETLVLEERLKILESSGKIINAIDSSYATLYASEDNVLSNLDKVIKDIEIIEKIYSNKRKWGEKLRDNFYQIEDISRELINEREHIVFDEIELNSIHERINLINNLYRKYGGSHESMEKELGKAEKNMEIINNISNSKDELKKRLTQIEKDLNLKGEMISEIRKKAASNLSDAIIKELVSLDMINAKFSIDFERSNYKITGIDKIDFKASFNKGEELKSFSKVASGGEVSRFILSLKSIISKYDDIDTMLFDEIDTGVSGLAAENIGKKMKEIAKYRQVLVITHLPQIASCADLHYKVIKNEDDSSTFTSIIKLENDERVMEIAKMMSGSKLTDLSIKNAKELLELNQVE